MTINVRRSRSWPKLDDITDPLSGFAETDFEDGDLPF
jgi:hypothetical protein|uniref:Uncharacterized protein n=1 Tax=Siphoviridae sp. cthae16 TaxID=2825617 RepID=A0A8S5URZ5_9CAUD|nr:MAG TPA: hypothetical protein [Siphoviridae sp. cthae16]